MKANYHCAGCALKQVTTILKKHKELSDDEKLQIVQEVLEILWKEFKGGVPAVFGTQIHRKLKKLFTNEDPFFFEKKIANQTAIKLYDWAKSQIFSSTDPLDTSIRFSLAGNMIDFAVDENFVEEIEEKILKEVEKEIEINDVPRLRLLLEGNKIRKVLYILDNAGEIVFDKLLGMVLKELGVKELVFAVRDKPILNDATLEDASIVNLQEVGEVITTGTDFIGVKLDESSSQFKEKFFGADLIIAKGMGNFESLTEYDLLNMGVNVLFLLKAKCEPVAKYLAVSLNAGIAKLVLGKPL